MTDAGQSEIDRVRAAYEERDAAPASTTYYTWENPAYVRYVQALERAQLDALRTAGIRLSGAATLEVGCGSGYFLHRLGEYGAGPLTGLELMPNRARQASERYPALDVHVGNGAEMPFADASFDLVTQVTCLSSVLDPGVRSAIGAEMVRVARPGGAILSVDMCPSPAIVRLRALARALRRSPAPATAAGTPVEPLSLDELRRVFGLEPAAVRRTGLPEDVGPLVARHRPAGPLLDATRLLRTHLVAVFRVPAR